jgi:hypothetical protein
MSTENETGLAIVNPAAMQQASEFASMNDAGISGNRQTFLPRFQLFTAASQEVKQGKVPVAVFGLVNGEDIEQLGKSVIVSFVAWRPKAMNFKSDPPQSYYRPSAPEFQDFKNRSAQTNSGYGYGPEMLIWMGDKDKGGKGWATFFLCTPTLRNAGQEVEALLPRKGDGSLRVAVLAPQFIDDGTNQWHGLKVLPSNQSLDLPDPADLEHQVKVFLSPKDFDPVAAAARAAQKAAAKAGAGATDNVAR